MKFEFTKMQGCGNDYIFASLFDTCEEIKNRQELAKKLSDRHNGIGSDGLIFACPSNIADVKMEMYNSDGSIGKMCGNGIRCLAKFVYDKGIIKKDIIEVETLSGIKTVILQKQKGKITGASVDMGEYTLSPSEIPVNLDGESVINRKITLENRDFFVTCVGTGNPHCVIFAKDFENINIEETGKLFERSSLFPEGINVEFVVPKGKNILDMRAFERGSGVTKSCGTGACASAAAAILLGFCESNAEIKVIQHEKSLFVKIIDRKMIMSGEAVKVFSGIAEI